MRAGNCHFSQDCLSGVSKWDHAKLKVLAIPCPSSSSLDYHHGGCAAIHAGRVSRSSPIDFCLRKPGAKNGGNEAETTDRGDFDHSHLEGDLTTAGAAGRHRTDRLTAAVQPGVEGPEGVQAALPGAADALWFAGPGDPGGQGERERRCGAEPSSVQAGAGSGVDAAWQPRLRQSGCVRGVLAADVRAVQCGSACSSRGGVAAAASVAGASAGGVQTRQGARGQRAARFAWRATSTR